MASGNDLEDQSCSICFDSNEFRVLQCGHAFCLKCLNTLYFNHGGKVCCPMDRKEDDREPISLPTPIQFQGHLYRTTIKNDKYENIKQLIDDQVKQRMHTVQVLRNLAASLGSKEHNCAIAKITGSAAGVVGSAMAIAGLSLSLTGVGAVVGVPLALTGTGIGIAGGATTGITIGVEAISKKFGLEKVNEVLATDYFKAEQIKVLLCRAADDNDISRKWKIDPVDIASVQSLLPKMAGVGLATSVGVRVALSVGRAAATTGLHVAGLVFAALVIPVDIAQMVASSIQIHKNEASQVIKDINQCADFLEKELKIFLIEGKYFQLIHTIDGYWAYIVIFAECMEFFKTFIEYGLSLANLEDVSYIVQSGEGDVPDDVKKKIQDEWYCHTDEVLGLTM